MRLDHIVVGAALQPGHPVGHGVARGQHDDRYIVGRMDAPGHLQPVEAGQHQVEDHQVGRAVACGGQGGGAVAGQLDRVALEHQAAPQIVGDLGLIFDDQDTMRHGIFLRVRRQAPIKR